VAFAAAALSFAAVAGIAACGGTPASSSTAHSGSPANATTSAGPSGPVIGAITLRGTVSVHGAVTEQMPFTYYLAKTTQISSCAEVGSNGTGAPPGLKPQFTAPTPAAGSAIYIVAAVVPYSGPGSYGHAALLAGGGTDIHVGSAMYNALAPNGTATVTVSANGSGMLTFTGATQVSPGKPTLSGSVTWTCSS
jgi:hypothetical protein